MPSNLLAIDSSTEYGSICLSSDMGLFNFHELMARRHASDTLPEIERLLSQAGLTLSNLDGVVFGRGPGSFTGLRIAAGIVQGLALALDLPVYPVSTLTALAMDEQHRPGDVILPALDARMEEIYWCPHRIDERGIPVASMQERVLSPSELEWSDEFQQAITVGNGWSYQAHMPDQFRNLINVGPDASNIYPKAESMIHWVRKVQPEPVSASDINPVYLRDKVTWDNKPKVGS